MGAGRRGGWGGRGRGGESVVAEVCETQREEEISCDDKIQ